MLVIDETSFKKSTEWYLARVKSHNGILITKDAVPWLVLITAEEYDGLRGFK